MFFRVCFSDSHKGSIVSKWSDRLSLDLPTPKMGETSSQAQVYRGTREDADLYSVRTFSVHISTQRQENTGCFAYRHVAECGSFLHFDFILFLFCMYGCFACLRVYVPHTCPKAREARRAIWILGDRSYRQLWATMRVLGIEPRSSGKTTCALSPEPSLQPAFLCF